MRKILFVGAEVMPFAATGGLGDVLGSLPTALKKEYGDDIDVRVVLPLYDAVKPEWRNQMKLEAVFNLQLSWRNLYCGVLSLVKDGVTYYFIDNEYYFKRGALYGYDDEDKVFFSKGIGKVVYRSLRVTEERTEKNCNRCCSNDIRHIEYYLEETFSLNLHTVIGKPSCQNQSQTHLRNKVGNPDGKSIFQRGLERVVLQEFLEVLPRFL